MHFFQTIWNERNRKVLFENKEFSYKKLKKKKKIFAICCLESLLGWCGSFVGKKKKV